MNKTAGHRSYNYTNMLYGTRYTTREQALQNKRERRISQKNVS